MSPLSYTRRCVQDDCNRQTHQMVVENGRSIIIQSGLHLREGWLILQSGELQEVAVCSKMEQTEIHRFMGVFLKFERKVAGMLKICVSDLKSEGWNFAKFGKVRSINPNSIGDNGLVQWHHHPIRSAPKGRLAHSAK